MAVKLLLGKKTLENEILREAVERVTAPKKGLFARELVAGGRPVSAVALALDLSRPNLSSRHRAAARRLGRPPAPDAELVAAIRALVADLPTYGIGACMPSFADKPSTTATPPRT